MTDGPFTAKDKFDCAEREVKQRVRVYDRLIRDGKMSVQKAEREMALMRAIADDYWRQSQKERLL